MPTIRIDDDAYAKLRNIKRQLADAGFGDVTFSDIILINIIGYNETLAGLGETLTKLRKERRKRK